MRNWGRGRGAVRSMIQTREKIMIDKIYQKYFQKSKTFLYPTLGYSKADLIQPVETYICWTEKGKIKMKPGDYKLAVLYDNTNSLVFRDFEETFLRKHLHYESHHEGCDNQKLYIFNLGHMKEDFDKFLAGSYSKFSDKTKEKIIKHYGAKTKEASYLTTYFYPEKYFELYSELLDEPVEVLESIGELCDRYDPLKECVTFCTINKSVSTETA